MTEGKFQTELDNKYVNETFNLDPNSTAVVLIDVWNDGYSPTLTENEELRLLPLLQLARHAGFLVIHAPSEGKEWNNITVLPGELLVTGENGTAGSDSRCDWILRSKSITTVLVAGYDTNYCVVDKPCGVVALSSELAEAEVILVRDATRPEPFWYHNAWKTTQVATNMLVSTPNISAGHKLSLGCMLAGAGILAQAPIHPVNHCEPAPRFSRWWFDPTCAVEISSSSQLGLGASTNHRPSNQFFLRRCSCGG